MGRSLLIIAGATAVLAMYSLIGGAGTSTTRSVEIVADHAERVLAREIALSAHASTVTSIQDEIAQSGSFTGPQQFQGSFQGGMYMSFAETSGDTLTLVTRATRPNTSYVVRGTYRIGDGGAGGPGNVPDFMSFGLLVENDFTITGNSRIYGTPGNNANVHTNGSIDIGGNSLVQGFGTHVTGASSGASQHFDPVENPDERETVAATARVSIPEFQAANLIDLATIVTHGNLHLSDAALGTPENPTIWHVTGDLIANKGKLSGHGIFIVEGDIKINGNVTTTSDEGGKSSVAFYSSGDVTLNGTATLYGQVFADGDLTMNGNATLYGNATTRGNAILSGNFNIHYRTASSDLTNPIWPGEGGDPHAVVLINYREGG